MIRSFHTTPFICAVGITASVFATDFTPSHDTYVRRMDVNGGKSTLLEVKDTAGKNNTDRIALIRYDIGTENSPVSTAKLSMSLEQTDTVIINVYGVLESCDAEKFDEAQIKWRNNHLLVDNDILFGDQYVVKLGSFSLEDSDIVSTAEFTSEELVNFINLDSNGTVTLMLSRKTNEAGSLSKFASKEHQTLPPITLTTTPGTIDAQALPPATLISNTEVELKAQATHVNGATDLYFVWGLADGAFDFNEWENSTTYQNVSLSNVVTHAAAGLKPYTEYYWRAAVSNEAVGLIWDSASYKTVTGVPSEGATNTWIGAGNASVAENWSQGTIPTEDSIILLGPYSREDMIWDYTGKNGLPETVAGWVQEEKFTGRVTFPTTFSTITSNPFKTFNITGDVIVDGGTICGQQQTATWGYATYQLNLAIGGNLSVGEFGSINQSEKGYWGCGPGRAKPKDKLARAAHAGSSGTNNDGDTGFNTYGSILFPSTLGSSTEKPSDISNRGGGGGALWIDVAEDAIINGSLYANGLCARSGVGGAAGGSIYLSAKSLTGSGQIYANGGNGYVGSAKAPCGGGGRISINLTEGTNLDEVEVAARSGAKSSSMSNNYLAGAGTVFIKTADTLGTIIVDNNDYSASLDKYTHIPAAKQDAYNNTDLSLNDDLTGMDLVAHKRARVMFTENLKLGTIDVDMSSIYLEGHTIYATCFIHGEDIITDAGEYIADDFEYLRDNVGGGKIVILPFNTIISIR